MDLKSELWSGKRVLVTGHTGFKGSWLTLLLKHLGAEVIGISLPPNSSPSLYIEAKVNEEVELEFFQDIRDAKAIAEILESSGAQYVFHLAAQAFVRKSFKNPLESYEINICGTANVLKAALEIPRIEGITIVTTDKVYKNDEKNRAFVESDVLGGNDPYSASKAAAEIVVASLNYAHNDFRIPVTTVRAGNVIGGGDWGEDRLVPDIVRAISTGSTINLRNPKSTRPWQHVLDCLIGYLLVAQSHLEKKDNIPHSINFGPNEALTVMDLVTFFEKAFHEKISVQVVEESIPENPWLNLDSSLATQIYGWHPALTPIEAVRQTADWYMKFNSGIKAKNLMRSEIDSFLRTKI